MKLNSLSVRLARSEDLSFIVRSNLAMARETEGKRLDEAVLEKGVSALLRDDRWGHYWVAEAERPVGCCMVTCEWSDWRNGLFWWLQSVYVIPEMRRKGVFTTLYQKVRQEAEGRGDVCGLRLYVEKENTGAQKTYEALGMENTHYRLFEQEF